MQDFESVDHRRRTAFEEDFAEIYTAICQMGFIITLNTNATLMNAKYLELFNKYPPTAVNITLYGALPKLI